MGADRKWIIVRIDGKTVDIKAEATTIFKGNDIEDVNLEYRKQTSYQTDSHRQGDQTAELGAKYNNILTDEISFIEKLSFNGFNEGTD